MRGEALIEALEVEQREMRRLHRRAPLQVEQGGVFGVLGEDGGYLWHRI